MSDPDHLLREVVVSRLAPLMIGGPIQDLAQATQAARHAIASSADADPASWLVAAQGIGCGLATLDSLRLSMDPDLPVAMRLRLRGNAVNLRRVATLPARTPQPKPLKAAPPPPEPAAPPTPEPASQRQTQADWAGAMRKAAEGLAQQAPATAPEDRKQLLWRQVLTDVAHELGHAPAPQRRTELLRTTPMAGNPNFPVTAVGGKPRLPEA